jgi:hypothetical protein
VQPRRDAIGSRPHLPITNNGPVECRLLGAAAEVNPGSDAAGWRFPRVPVGAKTQSCNGLAKRASSTLPRRALGGKHHGSHRRAQTGELARQTVAADDGGGRAAARLRSSCRVSAVGKGHKETSPRTHGGHGAATNKRGRGFVRQEPCTGDPVIEMLPNTVPSSSAPEVVAKICSCYCTRRWILLAAARDR